MSDQVAKEEQTWPKLAWLRQIGTAVGNVAAQAIATDHLGHVFISGDTWWGALEEGQHKGMNDVFLAKFDTHGRQIWLRQIGTAARDGAQAIATDHLGHVFISGYTEGALEEGQHKGGADVFLAKFDTHGRQIWLRQIGAAARDGAQAIATDHLGHVFISGYTRGALEEGQYKGMSDVFLAKFDTHGRQAWLRQIGTAARDGAQAIATDHLGHVFISGYTEGALEEGQHKGSYDVFLAKFDTQGRQAWLRQIGTAAGDVAQAIATDHLGNVFISGYTRGALEEGQYKGGADVFLAKFDTHGRQIWLRQIGAAARDGAQAIATDHLGHVFISGYTEGALEEGQHKGGADVFLAKFDTHGRQAWLRQVGTAAKDVAQAIATDHLGNVFISGYTWGALEEGQHKGLYDVFLAKFEYISYDTDKHPGRSPSVADAPLHRDGTSQKQRLMPALDPIYFQVDERSIQELLVFARQYGRQLGYYNDQNQADGFWSEFIPDELDARLAYWNDPSALARQPDLQQRFSQPHLALFLTFLELLQQSRKLMNTFTQRHLDFYYREVLQLTTKPGIPDQVLLLAELGKGTSEVLIPQGTRLAAGKDSAGNPLYYQSNEELLANTARVASIMSLYVDIKRTGLRELRDQNKTEPEKMRLTLFRAVMGVPPQGNLPSYPSAFTDDGEDIAGNDDFFSTLEGLLNFIRDQLGLRLSEFRELMAYYQERKKSETIPPSTPDSTGSPDFPTWEITGEGPEWATINTLMGLSQERREAEPRNFLENLEQVLNIRRQRPSLLMQARLFDSLASLQEEYGPQPRVHNIYELYGHYLLERENDRSRGEALLKDAISILQDSISEFPNPVTFKAIMRQRTTGIRVWQDITEILQEVRRRKGMLEPVRLSLLDYYPDPMAEYLWQYVGLGQVPGSDSGLSDFSDIDGFSKIENLDGCYLALLELEDYLGMEAEEFLFLRQIQPDAPDWQWDRAFDILERVYRHNMLATARQDLQDYPDLKDYFDENPKSDSFIRQMGPNATEEQWKQAFSILQTAYQAALPEKADISFSPEEREWQNLYAATDATTLAVNKGIETASALLSWAAFGLGYNEITPPAPPGRIGLAIASPILALREGVRTITATLLFDPTSFGDMEQLQYTANDFPWQFFVSTEKRMIPIPLANFVSDSFLFSDQDNSLTIKLKLEEDADPIAPLAGPGAISPWPVLEILLADKPHNGTNLTKEYPPFEALVLTDVKLKVEVTDIKAGLLLQNEDGTLNPKKPFLPFGNAPYAGSRFYITHPEIAIQKLDSLTLEYEWINAPADFKVHYESYETIGSADSGELAPTPSITGSNSFTCQAALQDGNRTIPHSSTNIPLFPAENLMDLGEDPFPDHRYQRDPQAQVSANVLESDRYLQIELNAPDFQHDKYPRILSRQGQLAVHIAPRIVEFTATQRNQTTFTLPALPIPPLTDNEKENPGEYFVFRRNNGITDSSAASTNPEITVTNYDDGKKEITIGQVEHDDASNTSTNENEIEEGNTFFLEYGIHYPYSELVVNPPYLPKMQNLRLSYSALADIPLTAERDTSLDQVFHLYPFGYLEIAQSEAYANKNISLFPSYKAEGRLFLGIEDLAPPQTLSLLFQMAEGSANADKKPAPVSWHYLSNNQWKPLSAAGHLLLDTTRGLLHSGIMHFDIPADATRDNTRMPAGYHWIRAMVTENSDSLSNVVDIQAQAVSTTFINQKNAPEHLEQPLPPNSIKDAEPSIPGLKSLRQPYSSFRGKPAEDNSIFYTRVAERLRHKQRALTLWDYERLVLEAFPDIYKAKCLPADMQQAPHLPGKVVMIVIPDIHFIHPADPFAPKVPVGRLREIEAFLRQHAPPWADIEVKNPVFYPLEIRMGVRFLGEYTELYQKELILALKKYLSPWAYDQSADISLNREIYPSRIIDLVEQLPYVDFVVELEFILFHRLADGRPETMQILFDEAVQLDRPDAVIVSAAQHQITVLEDPVYDPADFVGINHMIVEVDFQISAPSIQTGNN